MLYPVKNEPVKSYDIALWRKIVRRKHVKRTEATNTLKVCFEAQRAEEQSTKGNTGN